MLLFVLFSFTGCDNGELSLVNILTGECDNEEAPYFNLPTIESRYDFRVRYFSRGWDYDGDLVESRRDFYARERKWLQEHPESLECNWRRNGFVPGSRPYVEIRVVRSLDDFAEPSLTNYTECFFDMNYLVVIELVMGNASLNELVYRIKENGTIHFRPLMIDDDSLPMESYWTVIIELDNRFQPLEFNAVFISNPWAES